jgi:hypothetical protein
LRYLSYYNAVRTLTIGNLSATKTYYLELYASRLSTTANNNTIFIINGVSKSISANNNLTNKALFTDLKPDGNGRIVVTIDKTATNNYLNGFILTELGSTVTTTNSTFVSGVEAANSLLQVQAFPNPSGDQFTLHVAGAENKPLQVRVVDVMGRVVEEKGRISSNTTLTIGRTYGPGVYFAEVIQGNRKATVKLVKQPRQ